MAPAHPHASRVTVYPLLFPNAVQNRAEQRRDMRGCVFNPIQKRNQNGKKTAKEWKEWKTRNWKTESKEQSGVLPHFLHFKTKESVRSRGNFFLACFNFQEQEQEQFQSEQRRRQLLAGQECTKPLFSMLFGLFVCHFVCCQLNKCTVDVVKTWKFGGTHGLD